jgi:hypothetical protein
MKKEDVICPETEKLAWFPVSFMSERDEMRKVDESDPYPSISILLQSVMKIFSTKRPIHFYVQG